MLKCGREKATLIMIFDEGITLCRITRSPPSRNPGHRMLAKANMCAWSHIATIRIPAPFWED